MTTRRNFLKTSLGVSTLLSLAPAAPPLLCRTARALETQRAVGETVLVVVELAGGNDGLNTVVPYGDDEYHRVRDTLRLQGRELHKIDALVGFHPRMEGFARLLKDGHLTVIQGVGYPNPHQGHPEAMRVWQSGIVDHAVVGSRGSPGRHGPAPKDAHGPAPQADRAQTGWIGRAVDSVCRPEEARAPAVFVGESERPLALRARRAFIPAVPSLDALRMHGVTGAGEPSTSQQGAKGAGVGATTDSDNPVLEFVRRSAAAAQDASRRIEAATAAAGPGGAEYPATPLAQHLRTIAQLIRADQGFRIFFTELGGGDIGAFDNHASQRDNHAAVLQQLSESVAAFVADLRRDKLLERVVLMTFSEFGRTVRENGRRGTDHGSAAPMFLAGGRLSGGLIGPHPNLTDLENGGQKFHTDFRRVYATLLDRWLGIPSVSILGEPFPPLDFLRAG